MASGSSPEKRPCEDGNENQATQNPTKRPCIDYNDTISVLVGPRKKSFTVHKGVICFRSKFFNAACSASWKEGQEGIVRLPTTKPSVFQMYMDWIYFSEIASKVTGFLTGPLIDLFLLGDMVDDKTLRNKVMDALQAHAYKARISPSPCQICRIWENTAEGSMLRKWALDAVLLRQRKFFKENIAGYPSDFVQQIALKLIEQTPTTSAANFLA